MPEGRSASRRRRPVAAPAEDGQVAGDVVVEEVRTDTPGSAAGAAHPVCTVALCPICAVVTAVGQVRPEVLEHVLLAGREVLLAMRSMIDARLETAPEPSPRMEHLRID